MKQNGNMKVKKTILEEAEDTIIDREKFYGSPQEVYKEVANYWSIYLGDPAIDETDVCFMMVLLKIAREMNICNRDNLVDAAGYLRLVEKIREGREDETDNCSGVGQIC